MSEYLSKKAVLEWLKEESTNTSYERIVRDTLTTTLLKIQSGRFDVPEQQVNYSEQDIQTALTRELTDDRVAIAAAYWLDASPHERWVPDGIILARYARHAIAEIERLRVKLTKAVEELKYVRLALSIAHDHGYDTEDRDIEKTIDRIDRSIRIIIGGETDATQTSSRS